MAGDREVVLECVVDVTGEVVTVIGLLPAGNRVFSIRYDGRTIRQERTPQVPGELEPEQLLADVQLALWPLEALQAGLRESGWTVTEPHAGTRRLLRSGRLSAEVHYADPDPWRGRMWLVNFEQDYSLVVDSLALEKDR